MPSEPYQRQDYTLAEEIYDIVLEAQAKNPPSPDVQTNRTNRLLIVQAIQRALP